MTRPNDPTTPDLEELLREGTWLRRLARGLVHDHAAAEDLAQEVAATALRERPTATGPGLQAWLRTVARRLAARTGERERVRRRAEHAAARPEAVERRAEDRLTLHVRLTEAILELEPTYRTALVLRYLEELPPREIAKRLAIGDAAARKRVSRGLAMLRERLDAEFGERRAWVLPVGALAFGEGWTPVPGPDLALPTTAAAATGAASLVGVVGMKKLLVGGLVAAALLVILDRATTRTAGPSADARSNVATSAPPALPARTGAEAHSSPARDALDERTSLVAPPPAGSERGRLLVVDPTGAPVADPVAVWLDGEGRAHELALDGDASAPLPEGCAGLRLVAGAPGFATTVARAEDEDDDLVLTLTEPVSLRGRLLVDGGPPSEVVSLVCSSWNRHLDLGHALETEQRTLLDELGLLELPHEVTALPDGSFEVPGLHPASTGRLLLPDSYRPSADPSESLVDYALPSDLLVVELTRLPHLFGRVVWADDGSPAGGGLIVHRLDRGTGTSVRAVEWVPSDGRFDVGLPLVDPADAASGLADAKVTLEFTPESGRPLARTFEFEVDAGDLPLDVGTLRLERAEVVVLRVTDEAGAPIAGAAVRGAVGSGTSDDAGRVQLAVTPGDAIKVYARGFALTQHALEELVPDAAGERRVTLRTGVVLVLETPGLGPLVTKGAGPTVTLGFDGCLLEGGSTVGDDEGRGDSSMMFAAYAERLRALTHGGGSPANSAKLRVGAEPLELSGLRPGLRLELTLADALGQALLRRTITLPETYGTTTETLAVDESAAGRLTVLVTDADGVPLDDAQVLVRVPGTWSTVRPTVRGRLVLDPVVAGSYSLTASAEGHLQTEVEGTHPGGDHTVTVALPKARAVTVAFEDPRGRRVAPDRVRLGAADGWSTSWSEAESDAPTRFGQAPFGPLTVFARFGGRELRHEVEAGVDEVVAPAPALGTLRVELATPPALTDEWGHLTLRVDDVELLGHDPSPAEQEPFTAPPEGRVWVREHFTRAATGSLALGARLPVGEYAVELVLVDGQGDDAPRRSLLARDVTITDGAREVLTTSDE